MITHEEAKELVFYKNPSERRLLEEYITQQETLQAELDNYKHNYKALKEFYDNSVAYGSKLQNELNTLKNDVARYFELKIKDCELHEIDEYYDLYDKLSKVGKEE